MATDRFGNAQESLSSSSTVFFPVTPSDSTDLDYTTKGITIAAAGTVKVTRLDGETVTLTLPIGRHSMRCTRIWYTGTTATGITAWC